MNCRERPLWTLVVVVCLGVLTLFTVNGHPFRERDIGLGINDDPAENHPFGLSERDAQEQPKDEAKHSQAESEIHATTTTETLPNIMTDVSVSPLSVTATPSGDVVLGQASMNKTNLTTQASSQANVTIIAATTQAGNNLPVTSIRSSNVNIQISPSQTIQNVAKNSSGINVATYTSSIKPSFTKTPTESSLSAKLSSRISPSTSKSASIYVKLSVNASSPVIAAVSSPVLPASNKPSAVQTTLVPSGETDTNTQNDVPSSQGPTTHQTSQGLSSVLYQNVSVPPSINSPSGDSISNKPSGQPPSNGATQVPSTNSPTKVSASTSTKLLIQTSPKHLSTGEPSTGEPSTGEPSTGVPSTGVPSTGVPSTGVPSTGIPSTGEPTTGVPSTGEPSTGVPSSNPGSLLPTTEIQPAASNHLTSKKISTVISTQKDAGKLTTQANEKPPTDGVSTMKVSSTVLPKETTKNAVQETTKEIATKAETTKQDTTKAAPHTMKKTTAKAAVTKEKTTAKETKSETQNNGRSQ